VDVAACLLHHFLDGHPSLPNDVRVISIAHVQFHCHTVALEGKEKKINAEIK
jgi:hypothetical protein